MSVRSIMDSQKERMRQKICAAISEIWHKETGSILPLSIEGTVCITPSPGRTTALQVSSHIPGKFPVLDENCEDFSELSIKRRKVNANGEWCISLQCPTGNATDNDQQRILGQKKVPSVRDDNNNHSEVMDAESILVDYGRNEHHSDDSKEETDHETESSDAEFSADNVEYATNDGSVCSANGMHTCRPPTPAQENYDGEGAEKLNTEEVDNNDSGVQDMSNVEEIYNGCHTMENSSETPKVYDLQDLVVSEPAAKEIDDDISTTPPPLVVDLSCHDSNQPVLSLVYSSAHVQTAIRNMLSSKLTTSTTGKASDSKDSNDTLCSSPVSTVVNGSTPHLIVQRNVAVAASPVVQSNEFVKISTPQALNFAKHSTPVSLVYPFGGKQIIQRQLHNILSIANTSPGGSIALESSPSLEGPVSISLPAVLGTVSSNTFIKSEPGLDQLANSTEQKSYKCEYCQKTFLFKSKYQEHLPVHTTERPFECHMCQRTYKYKYDLNVHQRTHLGIPTKSTVCPKCNQRFPTNKLLRVHISDVHKDEQSSAKVGLVQPLDGNLNTSVTVIRDATQDVQTP